MYITKLANICLSAQEEEEDEGIELKVEQGEAKAMKHENEIKVAAEEENIARGTTDPGY